MPAQWLENTGNFAERAAATLQHILHSIAQPRAARRLRRLVLALLAVWAVLALVRIIWALWPQPPVQPPPGDIINPVVRSQVAPDVAGVDREALVARKLFGEPGAAAAEAAAAAAEAVPEAQTEREGIEKGARETRLELTLRGVVTATGDGLGHAVIEYRNLQDVYAVDDELPVSGRVVLAKVMPGQVVLDNSGTYELLSLYNESDLDKQLSGMPAPAAAGSQQTEIIDKSADPRATELASGYRDQLYQNPQSLASLVRISAVREGGELRGYRVGPGQDAGQFRALGFEAGDLVTGVNGIALDNPANTMQLYRAMRSAGEAVFDIERDGQALSIRVELGAPQQ